MKYKRTLASLIAVGAITSFNLSAAELFKTGTSQIAATSRISASQTEVDNMLRTNMSIKEAHIYDLNSHALTADKEQLTLNLTSYLNLKVNKVSSSYSTSGSMIWKGRIENQNVQINELNKNRLLQESVILVLRNGKITGTVRTGGKLFKIQPLKSGQHLVLEIDENNMKPDHPPGAMQELEAEMQSRSLIDSNVTTSSLQVASNPVIKVLVLYTNGVSSEVADVPALTDLAIAETNQGYTNSGVNATVELAHLQSINYNSVSISTDLNRLKATSDGHMDSVHGLRDQHGADIVMLLVPDSGSACGRAAAIGATASSAFAVTAQDCATGYYSFGHELGHLQSARHNPETDSTTTPYAFGHGYRDPQSQWRTVMAYNCSSGCSRINWWSNPNKTRNGRAMGTSAVSDNTRVLNLTAATVAGFRGDATPPGNNVLTNGVAKTGISGSAKQEMFYTLDVPAGANNLTFTTTGSSGDADLFVKFGSKPSLSVYDCKSTSSSSNETCNISNVQTGTYHVMVQAYNAISGVSLTGSYSTTSNNTFSNTTDYSIPDNNSTGISSPISVTNGGSSSTVSVNVNIVHTYIGDLIVDLIDPSGGVHNLHNRSGGSANNINKTYSVNVGNATRTGTWNLRVKDRANIDTGKIDSWSITL